MTLLAVVAFAALAWVLREEHLENRRLRQRIRQLEDTIAISSYGSDETTRVSGGVR